MNALYVVCGLGFLSLLAEIVSFKKGLTLVIIAGLVAALFFCYLADGTSQSYYNNMLFFNDGNLFLVGLMLTIGIFWFWMSPGFFNDHPHQTDRSALVLFAMAGGIIMLSFQNMAMLFLGIEVLSISLYVLVGSKKESLLSNESSFKYFLMGSFATGFLLMGIALIYGATGSFDIYAIAEKFYPNGDSLPGFFFAGVLLMLVGMAFKISAVPFHFWAPDVYDGAPVNITAFMATIVKIAAIGAFLGVFSMFFAADAHWDKLTLVVQIITVLTLIVPNVTAVFQTSVKRILAYSSVGNVGYILLGFISSRSSSSYEVISYYLCAYSLASLAAFAVLQNVENSGTNTFTGLYKRSPLMTVVMSVALLSLAGIPPLAGFFAKYAVFSNAIADGNTGLVIIAIITSLIGVYYYFKVMISMYQEGTGSLIELSFSSRLLLVVLLLLIILAGVFPDVVLGITGR